MDEQSHLHSQAIPPSTSDRRNPLADEKEDPQDGSICCIHLPEGVVQLPFPYICCQERSGTLQASSKVLENSLKDITKCLWSPQPTYLVPDGGCNNSHPIQWGHMYWRENPLCQEDIRTRCNRWAGDTEAGSTSDHTEVGDQWLHWRAVSTSFWPPWHSSWLSSRRWVVLASWVCVSEEIIGASNTSQRQCRESSCTCYESEHSYNKRRGELSRAAAGGGSTPKEIRS